MNVARLKKLIYLLENHDELLPKTKFRMSNWACGQNEKHTCATTACALGSAAVYPPFMRAGLKLVGQTADDSCVAYKQDQGYTAGAAFLSISFSESHKLFSPDEYRGKNGCVRYGVTRKDVIKKIKKLLAGEEL